MASTVLADVAVSMSELKRSPADALAAGHGRPVAIMKHNRPTYYAVPASVWERISDLLEDVELNALCDARQDQRTIPVSLDDL